MCPLIFEHAAHWNTQTFFHCIQQCKLCWVYDENILIKFLLFFCGKRLFFHDVLSYKTKLINQLRTYSKVLKVRDATQFSKTTRRHSSVKYELINMTKHASEVYCLLLKTMAQLIILSRATKVSGLCNILA